MGGVDGVVDWVGVGCDCRCDPTHQPNTQPASQPNSQPASQSPLRLSLSRSDSPCNPNIKTNSQPNSQPTSKPAKHLANQPASQPNSQPVSQTARQTAKNSQPATSSSLSPWNATTKKLQSLISYIPDHRRHHHHHQQHQQHHQASQLARRTHIADREAGSQSLAVSRVSKPSSRQSPVQPSGETQPNNHPATQKESSIHVANHHHHHHHRHCHYHLTHSPTHSGALHSPQPLTTVTLTYVVAKTKTRKIYIQKTLY
ncbi:lateral signaling target protein 2 homolog [Portunus trituberculatus]|uniref:lateral signaling target protein 2 homolog n=1 Tax=Portunus trituberculatus TaxID=210409 RepID=UPI001E1CD5B7|nr:lateral signaling target protein 2 homolog [Portunus trituberculatus]